MKEIIAQTPGDITSGGGFQVQPVAGGKTITMSLESIKDASGSEWWGRASGEAFLEWQTVAKRVEDSREDEIGVRFAEWPNGDKISAFALSAEEDYPGAWVGLGFVYNLKTGVFDISAYRTMPGMTEDESKKAFETQYKELMLKILEKVEFDSASLGSRRVPEDIDVQKRFTEFVTNAKKSLECLGSY